MLDQGMRVLVCDGSMCRNRGAIKIRKMVKHWIKEQESPVIMFETGCLNLCMRGPNMIIYPQGLWYSWLTRDQIQKILDHPGSPDMDRYVSYQWDLYYIHPDH